MPNDTSSDIFEMRYLRACPACGGIRFVPFGYSIRVDVPHCAQSRCLDCAIVFSNPQCTAESLATYYGKRYWQAHWSQHLSNDPQKAQADLESQRPEAARFQTALPSGRILEIGSGSGALLAALGELRFEVHGLEPSAAAAERSRVCFGREHVSVGTLDGSAIAGAPFDGLVAWHVIEHVNELGAFVGRMRELLRPGGLLWLGTENYRNAGYGAAWLAEVVRGRPPPFATSGDHTFAFTAKTLAEALRRGGFAVDSLECYQDRWRDKRKHMRFRNPLGFAWFLAQHTANALVRSGPFIRVVAKRA